MMMVLVYRLVAISWAVVGFASFAEFSSKVNHNGSNIANSLDPRLFQQNSSMPCIVHQHSCIYLQALLAIEVYAKVSYYALLLLHPDFG